MFYQDFGPPKPVWPQVFCPLCPPPFAGLDINNDGVPCSDCSETKIYALNLSLLKTKEVVDILFIQIRTILLKLLYRAMLPTNTSIIKGYLIFYVSLIFTT